MSKTTANSYTEKKPRDSKKLSGFFANKPIAEKILSFLSEKEKFNLLCYSKTLLEEYDSKFDDWFMPRKYQEKIKNWNNNYEDLFYQILNEVKKEKRKNGQKVCLYEIENNMVKYLKYLTKKYNKIINISLINVSKMEIWKLDFISKILEILEKNIHLKLSLNSVEIKSNEIFSYICKFSKAINVLEIVDIYSNSSRRINIYEDIIQCFNWDTINKIIINLNDFIPHEGYENSWSERFLIKFLNELKIKNLIEFDLRSSFINFHHIEKFIEKNGGTIQKLNLDNYELKNDVEIDNNSLLKYFQNINELSLIIDENNLEKLLHFFYPIFPKIKKFKLIINESDGGINKDKESEDENDEKAKDKSKSKNKKKNKNKNNDKKRNKTKNKLFDKNIEKSQLKFCLNQINYYSEIPDLDFDIDDVLDENGDLDLDDDGFGNTKNINLKKITFTSEKKEIKKKCKKQNDNNFDNSSNYVSTLTNLINCESLIYEIKTNNIYSTDNSINVLSYLINVLEVNKNNLHYLEIYINNNDMAPLNKDDFKILIQAISSCKNLNTFIFDFELINEYALLFNNYFKIGNSLTNLSLVHGSELDINKIINDHMNLTHINLELISKKTLIINENYPNNYCNFDCNRNWKSIELTNYPITQSLAELLKDNKNILFSLDSCTNITDLDDKTINGMAKNSGDDNECQL